MYIGTHLVQVAREEHEFPDFGDLRDHQDSHVTMLVKSVQTSCSSSIVVALHHYYCRTINWSQHNRFDSCAYVVSCRAYRRASKQVR